MKITKRIVRATPCLALVALVAGCGMLASSRAAAPTTAPTTSPATAPPEGPSAKYGIPYGRPNPDEIVVVLERVRDRLESRMVLRIEPPVSKEIISDPPHALQVNVPGERPFGSLDYPSGVAYAGLLLAGQVTGDKKYDDFVSRRFQFVADMLLKFPEPGGFRSKNPFKSIEQPVSLDNCGAIGAAFIKAHRAGVGGDLKPVIDRFAKYISKPAGNARPPTPQTTRTRERFIPQNQFRLEDGTLARERPFANSLWADDMYMSVPFLAQIGTLTGQTSYYDDAARQVIQISDRLFTPSSGLYTHAWNAQTGDDQPRYYWGRANGWCIMAMVELLDVLPENHPQRPAILKLLRAHAKGLASVQSGEGLWHQMLDRPDSYLETSCSAMFTFAIARAVNRGWINAGTFGPVAIAAWDGLTTRIDRQGRVTGTCVGTGYAADYAYYYHRPATDDVHGYGPVLLAGAEMIKLLDTHRFQGSATQPIMLQERRPGGGGFGNEFDSGAGDSSTQPAAVDR